MVSLTAVLAFVVLLAAPPSDEASIEPPPKLQAIEHGVMVDSTVVARIETGLRTADPAMLLADAADPIDLAIFGHGASYSRSQSVAVLRDFFRRHPPGEVSLREAVASEDRRSIVGDYHEARGGEPARVFIRLRARDGDWEIRSIRIDYGRRR